MPKFKVLEYNEKIVSRMGLSARDGRSFLFYFILSFTFIPQFSCLYFVYLTWLELTEMSDTIAMWMAGIQALGMFSSFGASIDKYFLVHSILQDFVDAQDVDSDIHKLYWNVEQRCRKYGRRMMAYVICNQGYFLTPFVTSVYSLIVGNHDTSTWNFDINLYFPLDTSVIFYWYLSFIWQFFCALSYISSVVSMTVHFITDCFYLRGICDHFKLLIDTIVKDTVENQLKNNTIKWKNDYSKDKKTLCEAIKAQYKAYEVFELVAEIYSGAIFALFSPTVLLLALSMYNVEFLPKTIANMVYTLGSMIASLVWSFIFCYFADYTTEHLASIGNSAYNSNWYELSPDLQKYTILIIARSQHTSQFNGIGLFECTLELFGRICNSAYSYYMIFRNMAMEL